MKSSRIDADALSVIVKYGKEEIASFTVGYALPTIWPSCNHTPLVLQALKDTISAIENASLSTARR